MKKKEQISNLRGYGIGLTTVFSLIGLVVVNAIPSIQKFWDIVPILFAGALVLIGRLLVIAFLVLGVWRGKDQE